MKPKDGSPQSVGDAATPGTGMIRVQVLLSGWLAAVAGQSELTIEVRSGTALLDLVRLLWRSVNPEFRRFLLDSRGEVDPSIMIMVEDTPLPRSRWSGHRFDRDVRLRIVSVVAGG